MKIAYLLGSLNRGGTETLLLDVFRNAKANQLNAIGIYRKGGVFEEEFLNSGVKMIKLSFKKIPLFYLFRLRSILLANKIDIAHAQQPIDALYAWIATIATPVKVVLTLHGYDMKSSRFNLLILRFILNYTGKNIYVSNTQKNYYSEKYKLDPDKQILIYNGISFSKLDGILDKSRNDSLRSELNIGQDTHLIGSVGNFVEVRDQLTLCRFFDLLQKKNIDFHAVFIGKSSESSPHLFQQCVDFCALNNLSNKVTFLGSRSDVPSILHQLDSFVYASDHDTFGIAVIEAMACSVPTFVNDWGVMKEITENGKFATLYTTKDSEDLFVKFWSYLSNKNFYEQSAKNASDFVREKYCIENHINDLKSLYKICIRANE